MGKRNVRERDERGRINRVLTIITAGSSWKIIVVASVAVAGVLVVMIMGLIFGVVWHKQSRKREPGEARAKAVLYGVSGYYAASEIELDEALIVIGRDPQQCRLTYPHSIGDISKRHCTLRYEAANRVFLLEDCDSVNGTFVLSNGKGERLAAGQSRRLKSGDKFYLSGPENLFTVQEESMTD